MEWLRGLAHGPLSPNGPTVNVMHGSPIDEDEYVLSMRDAWGPLADIAGADQFLSATRMCREASRRTAKRCSR